MLVIAHRLATIQKAEQICIIRKGKIEAAGTHEQLSLHSESYRALMGTQIVQPYFKEGITSTAEIARSR